MLQNPMLCYFLHFLSAVHPNILFYVFQTRSLKNVRVLVCVRVHVRIKVEERERPQAHRHICHVAHVEVVGQPCGVSSLLPLWVLGIELHSSGQVYMTGTTERSLQP